MKRTVFKLAALLVAVVLIALGVELAGNIYLYMRDGRYISARERIDADRCAAGDKSDGYERRAAGSVF